MEIKIIDNPVSLNNVELAESSSEQFIKSNSTAIAYNDLKHKCIIPSFKDNESTISHTEFVDAVGEVVDKFYFGTKVLNPAIRISHPINGRVPEAVGKPAKELIESEKTIYYERMAFLYEIPDITETVAGNKLALTVGGVRAYNHENLYSRKTEEKFKVFVGFQNKICINLCISTDGFVGSLKVRTVNELANEVYKILTGFNPGKQLEILRKLDQYSLSEKQFATLVGRARMYGYLSVKDKKIISEMPVNDSQVSSIIRGYYDDSAFKRSETGEIDFWRLYNLFTGAVKSSYIDTFLDRNVGSFDFIGHLVNSLDKGNTSWYLS